MNAEESKSGQQTQSNSATFRFKKEHGGKNKKSWQKRISGQPGVFASLSYVLQNKFDKIIHLLIYLYMHLFVLQYYYINKYA